MTGKELRTDEQLVDAANGGEVSAFDLLYFRYRDWVVRLAYRYTADRDDALDVLQETFTYLLRKFPGFRLTARMTTFLYPVVKHIAVRIARKRRRVTFSDDLLAGVPATGEGPPSDARAELALVMASLPDAQREVVLMRFVDDMALKEIAAALDIPLGTVKSRLHHALNALRNDPKTLRYFSDEMGPGAGT